MSSETVHGVPYSDVTSKQQLQTLLNEVTIIRKELQQRPEHDYARTLACVIDAVRAHLIYRDDVQAVKLISEAQERFIKTLGE